MPLGHWERNSYTITSRNIHPNLLKPLTSLKNPTRAGTTLVRRVGTLSTSAEIQFQFSSEYTLQHANEYLCTVGKEWLFPRFIEYYERKNEKKREFSCIHFEVLKVRLESMSLESPAISDVSLTTHSHEGLYTIE